MRFTFDQNLFTQVGLDSGALTMLAGVTHTFQAPGQYRGAVYRGKENVGVFYLNVDKSSPVAQATIDLSCFESKNRFAAGVKDSGCCGSQTTPGKENIFDVNAKGYVVFHLSEGAGGYAVRLGRAEEDPKQQFQFDSRQLNKGDIFSAVILRPGTYSVTNALGKGKGEITVTYPKLGKQPYRPPNPSKMECTAGGFEPARAELQPGQALLFHCSVPSHIKIELVKADDGPGRGKELPRPGWKKIALPEKKK